MASLLETEVTGAADAVIHLKNYAARIEHFSDLWPDIIHAFTERESLWFGAQGEGSWPALSPTYAAWKAVHYPGKPILVQTGALRESLTGERAVLGRTDHMLVLGTNDPKARWHQTGTGKMPARPPLIPKVRLEAAIARLLDLWVSYKPGGWGQRR